jgi:hypothetical protein
VIGSSGSFSLDTGVVKDSVQYQLCRLVHQIDRPPEQLIKAQQPYEVTVHNVASESVHARGAISPTFIHQRLHVPHFVCSGNADPSGDTNSTLHIKFTMCGIPNRPR